MGLICGFIEIERNSQLYPNRLTILHPWLKFVLLDKEAEAAGIATNLRYIVGMYRDYSATVSVG